MRACIACGSLVPGNLAACPSCGDGSFLGVIGNAIISFPPGTVPCPVCDSEELPLVFRAWVRHTGYLIGSREGRSAAYVCQRCADRRCAAALAWTGLFGWWSISSLLFGAPRATFFNWVGAFRAPIHPLAWGAMPLDEFLRQSHAERESHEEMFVGSDQWARSPFMFLGEQRTAVVLSASGLYETLEVSPDVSQGDLRRAYGARAKAVHPDLHGDAGYTNDEIVRVNKAWEILRDEHMRAAYDWLEANRAHLV